MQSLKVKDLKPHPKNEYFFDDMTGQKYEEFRESIRTSGVIEPLIVTQDMVIVSGHQRRRGCIDEGIETVMCDVRYYADKDGRSKEDWILKDLIETNVRQRGEIGGSELKAIHRVDELRRIYGVDGGGRHKSCETFTTSNPAPQTAEEVCATAGIDYALYRKYKSLVDLNPEWQEMFESGNVSVGVATSIIAKLPSDKQTELLESFPADAKQRLTASEAKRYIDMLEQQQKEYDKQIAEMKQQNRKDIAELNDDNDAKAQRVIELENTVKELRTKRDPAMKKLYEQSERERQLSQSLQATACQTGWHCWRKFFQPLPAVFKTLMFSDISCAAYQRPINYARCKYIKEHFNPDMVGTLLVSHRTDGTYVIIDGHHRMIAMQMCGLKGHLCQVLEGLSYEDEAKLFIEFNNKL